MKLNQLKLVSWVWIILGGICGIAGFYWAFRECFIDEYKEFGGGFQASLIFMVFGFFCILGAIGNLKKFNWGRIILIINSILVFLYAFLFFVGPGIEDTGILSAFFVLSVCAFCIYTFFSLLIENRKTIIENNIMNSKIKENEINLNSKSDEINTK